MGAFERDVVPHLLEQELNASATQFVAAEMFTPFSSSPLQYLLSMGRVSQCYRRRRRDSKVFGSTSTFVVEQKYAARRGTERLGKMKFKGLFR